MGKALPQSAPGESEIEIARSSRPEDFGPEFTPNSASRKIASEPEMGQLKNPKP
jgi:hypothetical protein